MLFYLYSITNNTNGKLYVGVTNEPKERWRTHQNIALGGKEKHPRHFQPIHAAITKYGCDNFSFEVVKVFSSEEECYCAEEDYITYLKQMEVGIYNIAGGGKGTGSGENHPMFGKTLPQEWKENAARAAKESSNRPEVKAKHRKNMLENNWVGENHPMFGKIHSDETRRKISESGKGRIFSEEHRNNLSNSLTGKVRTEEQKQAMSKNRKGKYTGIDNPNFGKKWTEEQKKSLSNKKKGKPSSCRIFNEQDIKLIFSLRNNGMSFAKIAKQMKTSKSVIMNIIKGKTYIDVVTKIK